MTGNAGKELIEIGKGFKIWLLVTTSFYKICPYHILVGEKLLDLKRSLLRKTIIFTYQINFHLKLIYTDAFAFVETIFAGIISTKKKQFIELNSMITKCKVMERPVLYKSKTVVKEWNLRVLSEFIELNINQFLVEGMEWRFLLQPTEKIYK